MASRVFIPFDNNPISTTVITASFTIPAGRYANIVANLEGSATITINGTTALRGTQNNVLGSTSWGWSSGVVGQASTNGGSPSGSVFSSVISQKTVVQSFFVPTGTVINGTGTWRAIVVQYNAVS